MKRGTDGMFQRHGGIIWRSALLIMLVLVVVFFMRSPPAVGPARYGIVFDAGSTGSRIHVFKFTIGKGATLELESDTFEQLKPGLSSYADEPAKAAESLQPLLDVALGVVPPELQAETPVMVGATAGLRLLPEGKADVILAEVAAFLQASHFKLVTNGVRVIDGTEEGAFAWLTLNYLLGSLGKTPQKTVAAIDLGGGSVQQAFALTPEAAAAVPAREDYVMPLGGGGRAYDVYVHSYLGFGLMAGRAAILNNDGYRDAHPCVPKEHDGSYEYAGNTHPVKGHPEGASFERCTDAIAKALNTDKACGAPQDECSFDGVWMGKALPKVLYVSSYFWDRATDSLIISDENAVTAEVKVSSFGSAASEACSAALPDLNIKFPKLQEMQAPFMCMDLSFMHSLLTKGFSIPDDSMITLVKRIMYKGQEVEAAWPLGAAINMMS